MNIAQFDDKTQARFRELAREVQKAREVGANHGTVLSDAIRAMKRANGRQETLPAEAERVEIVQQNGPTLEFSGRLLLQTSFEAGLRDPMRVEFEIYETLGGALVAVSSSQPAEREGFELVNALVVEPQDDAQAMHFAIMGHFNWHDRARTMAKKLGWNLRVEVD